MGESRGGSHLNKSNISSAGDGLLSLRAVSCRGVLIEVPSGVLAEVSLGVFKGVLTVVLTGVLRRVEGTAVGIKGTGDIRRRSLGTGTSARLGGNSGGREHHPGV